MPKVPSGKKKIGALDWSRRCSRFLLAHGAYAQHCVGTFESSGLAARGRGFDLFADLAACLMVGARPMHSVWGSV
jgi:hypothetical protein